jgi:glycosyltransferase involved in cell wall biosynthesis
MDFVRTAPELRFNLEAVEERSPSLECQSQAAPYGKTRPLFWQTHRDDHGSISAVNDLRPLILSTFDTGGGASRAALRLHQGLRRIEVPSQMLTFFKASRDPDVTILPGRRSRLVSKAAGTLDGLPLRMYPRRQPTPFSVNWLPYGAAHQINKMAPTVVHLHWVQHNMVPVAAWKRIKAPIVWTLHDEWAYTGGCHLTLGCQKFMSGCGACPQLVSTHQRDLSRWLWEWKHRVWSQTDMVIITPSRWLAGEAKRSPLLHDKRIEIIPNGIDTSVYQPVDRAIARRIFKLDPHKRYILFGAVNTSDPNKGFGFLLQALQRLAGTYHDRVELLIFGGQGAIPDLGLKAHNVGFFADDLSLTLLYSAADVFVAPSKHENLPNTVIEAMACGVPSVGFHVGGMPDLITHQETGYLAQPYDVDDLARGLSWVIENDPHQLGRRAREKIERELELEAIAKRHLDLYESL